MSKVVEDYIKIKESTFLGVEKEKKRKENKEYLDFLRPHIQSLTDGGTVIDLLELRKSFNSYFGKEVSYNFPYSYLQELAEELGIIVYLNLKHGLLSLADENDIKVYKKRLRSDKLYWFFLKLGVVSTALALFSLLLSGLNDSLLCVPLSFVGVAFFSCILAFTFQIFAFRVPKSGGFHLYGKGYKLDEGF